MHTFRNNQSMSEKSMEKFKQLLLIPVEDERPELDLLDKPCSLDEFTSDCYSPYPNQAIRKFVELNSTGNRAYAINPLPENLVAGKNTYAYDAHTYHTKVPPEAIRHLIEHYTEQGDIILDPFCGSGMTGVAALRAQRKPILIDLSPAATFIAANFLTPVDEKNYLRAIKTILTVTHDDEMMLYGTHCRTCGKLVPMEYMVWSYGLICEFCHKEFVLWDVARDEREDIRESKIKSEFDCPHCNKHLQKRKLRRTKLYPVQTGYRCCNSGLRESKDIPDEYDLSVIRTADSMGLPNELWYPTAKLPAGVNTRQAIAHGLESVDALYTRRNLHAVARLWDIACRWKDKEICLKLMFTVTSLYQRVTRLSEFRFWGGSGNTANYNVPMIFNEQNVFKVFNRKAKTIQSYLATWNRKTDMPFCISTQSATDLRSIPDNSIDYIFTDPPFGSNINYSEMNYLWEAWFGVFTDAKDEAIINRVQGKTIENYCELMAQALSEIHRVLKPGRWLTLVFHNSSSDVWSAIQIALLSSGFKIEITQTLDKRHGTFKQFVSENAVGYDLILHCRKNLNDIPNAHVPERKTTSRSAIHEFIARTLKQNPDEFVIRYLHVRRKSELDSRKLYSLWLKERMESEETVDLDYCEFREIVNQVVQSEFSDKNVLKAE
jgi:DNA modification methylase